MGKTASNLIDTLSEAALRALIEAMYLTAYADQEFSDEEQEFFARSLRALTDDRVDEAMLSVVIDELEVRKEQKGLDYCLERIASHLTTSELKSAAIVLASDMAAADGVIKDSERALIAKLAEALGVEQRVVAEALDGLRSE